jgi:hypothetical protein
MSKARHGAYVLCWHFSDMALVLDDVRSQRRSGNHLLLLNISHFDPEGTSYAVA